MKFSIILDKTNTMKKVIITTILLSCISLGGFSQTIDTDYETQRKKIVKMEFFSPLFTHTTLGFENYAKDWLSWEAKIGFIGLGVDNQELNPSGVLFRVGPKFKLNPDFVTRDLKGSHLLGGKYIRPEIVFSIYSEDTADSFTGESTRQDYSSFAILITYGRQYILADIMSLDYHIGLGYGFDNVDNDLGGKYHFSHSNGGGNFPIAISAGFTIGVLLK